MIELNISSVAAVPALLAATQSDAASGRDGPALTSTMLLVSIVVTVLLGIAVYCLVHRRRRTPHDNARVLFRDLCRTHHLSRYQSQLLKRLGVVLKLDCASVLFVDNTLWKLSAAPMSDRNFTEKEWQKLHVVQRTLFMPAAVKPSARY